MLRDGFNSAHAFYPGFNTTVIAFASGVAAYFAWPTEPDIWLVIGSCGFACAIWIVFQRTLWPGVGAIWLIFMLMLGLGRAAWHTSATDRPRLPQQERTYRIEGWVSAIEKSGKSERFVVELLSMRGMTAERMPEKLRIRITKKPDPPIGAGETINWLVASKAPPGAVVPGGYDPGQSAYFKGIGGFGFGYGAPETQTDAELNKWDSVRRAVVRWRYGLADRVVAAAPPQTSGLQAALMTGVRRFIPQQQTDNLRIAGLAHILAISGLHMALLAGGTYSGAAFLLACILPLSRRYDVRKFAAMAAIGAATFYLVLSGASVATQRAWVMSTIFFLAIILDRRAVSMRSVSVAALITLALHPESLVSVGFQMSFAAVVALVAVYQAWQIYRPAYTQRGLMRRGVDFISSLSVTSFVAGLATGAFALFHFNRFAKYGFAGNLLAMPLFSIFVMPLAVVSLLSMPFGWEAGPLYLMSKALEPILLAADWVSSWPGAMLYIGAAPDWVLPQQSPSEVPEECMASDLVILAVRSAGPVARRGCDAVLIDESSLRETGALDVYLGDRLTTKPARPPKERRRAWDN